ncbi:MAG TPA: Hsp70 family protein [Streptosporangiaceae bacterium]|nr:Hsp70 family protein [Streptosporangiaceae bacterium]
MSGRVVLGIDLGTTNSVVASIDDEGEVFVVRNAVGEEITPSVVYFEPDGVVVGEEARQATAVDPVRGVRLIKRHMGTEFPMEFGGEVHTPESISALILRQLVSTAPGGGSSSATNAVITVPAYFGLAEREATYQAGVIAGLNVLELLDEPVAAAAHYGLTSARDLTVLVYDLGGGTFDTTVLRITDGAVSVLATDGHHALGGADVDARLLDLALSRIEPLIPADAFEELTEDGKLLGSLTLDIEAAKQDLSTRASRDLYVLTPAGRIKVGLTRSDLEAACADLFDTTAEIIERVIESARLAQSGRARKIEEVIMVGGSSRIPLLSDKLAQLFGVQPRLVEPDLAVAKGAAIRAHQILATSQLSALARSSGRSNLTRAGTITPVTPRAIGILIDDSFDASGERKFVEHLVHANTRLPVTETVERFGTILADQQSVRIQVYEQSGASPSPEVGHNRRVLDGELTGIGSLPAGSVIRITVTMAIDGRLTVIAHEPVSGRELTLEAFVEGVVDSEETQRLTKIVGLAAVRG